MVLIVFVFIVTLSVTIYGYLIFIYATLFQHQYDIAVKECPIGCNRSVITDIMFLAKVHEFHAD